MNSTRRRTRRTTPSMGTVLITAAVAYGTYRFASWAWDSWNHREDEDERGEVLVPVSRTPNNRRRQRNQRMARCRDEVAIAMHDFLPTLRRTIEALTDTSLQTKGLKELRGSQDEDRHLQGKELWNVVKTKALTRMIATAYAHSILFLVLTTQVFLMGGKLFEEQTQGSEAFSSLVGSVASDRMSSYQASHRIVLTQTYDYFFDKGISLLVKAVERAVDVVVADWDVTHPSSTCTTKETLDKAIQDIRFNLEGRTARGSQLRARSILRFLIPPDLGNDPVVTDYLAQSVMDETLDILESPVFDDAQQDCLEATITIMREKSLSKIFLEIDLPQHVSSPWGSKPLASVLSKLKFTSNTFYETMPLSASKLQPSETSVNMYLSTIQRLPAVLELADVSFA